MSEQEDERVDDQVSRAMKQLRFKACRLKISGLKSTLIVRINLEIGHRSVSNKRAIVVPNHLSRFPQIFVNFVGKVPLIVSEHVVSSVAVAALLIAGLVPIANLLTFNIQ